MLEHIRAQLTRLMHTTELLQVFLLFRTNAIRIAKGLRAVLEGILVELLIAHQVFTMATATQPTTVTHCLNHVLSKTILLTLVTLLLITLTLKGIATTLQTLVLLRHTIQTLVHSKRTTQTHVPSRTTLLTHKV